MWQASQFLSGSSSNEVPYEVVGCLSIALNEWVDKGPVISTALLDSQEFYFNGLEPSIFIKRDIDSNFNLTLIQIALPKLYKNNPLYNVALYHELGHFIDRHYKITESSLLIDPPPKQYPPNTNEYNLIVSHRMEYFADLFASCYIGDSVIRFLKYLFGEHQDSLTHPSTKKRADNVADFLSGKGMAMSLLFNDILSKRGLPTLSIRYEIPDIKSAFDDYRPYRINSEQELHGIYVAAWDYYESALKGESETWDGCDVGKINRTINDLVEKSIRNRMILDKWN